jgi:hypothetical protein
VKRSTALIAVIAAALLPALLLAADDKDAAKDSAKDSSKDSARAEDRAGQAGARTQQQAQPDAEGFITLFDGKSLDGWKANENPESFKLKDGNIVVNGERSHLFYVGPVKNHDFKNFHFKAEVMTFPNSNSGIYFHTKWQDKGFPDNGFECQVNNTYTHDPKKTGGLYSVKDVMNTAPVGDNEWFTYEIIAKGNNVQIKINGKTTTDWTQPADWKPRGFSGRKLGSGTFALQGHDPGSKVMFRNIKVKPLD